MIGELKVWRASRGFGFLAYDGGKELFVHVRDFKSNGIQSVYLGDRFEFDVKRRQDGKDVAVGLKFLSRAGKDVDNVN
ncbi:MAG: cold shock domain-containing protein [Verrucomicrobiota bacterium]